MSTWRKSFGIYVPTRGAVELPHDRREFGPAMIGAVAGSRRRTANAAQYVGNGAFASTTTIVNSFIVASGKFKAPFSGTITKIEIYSACATSSSIKVGLYTESTGPANKIDTETTLAAGAWSAGWRVVDSLSYSVTAENTYWIAFANGASTQVTLYYETGAALSRYRDDTHTYANAWPSPFEKDTNSSANFSFRAYLEP